MPPERSSRTRILGLGAHLPGDPVSNAELARRIGVEARDLGASPSISVRHWAGEGQGASDLGLIAARAALDQSGTAVEDLDLIIFATTTPDVGFPGSACYLQAKLGASEIGSLDVRAQTGGFLCALELAESFSGLENSAGEADTRYSRVLVAAAEVHSTGLDWSPGAELTPRFGDGAAAIVMGTGERGARCLSLRWAIDGSLANRFWCEAPASRQYPHRLTAEDLAAGKHYPSADLPYLADIVRARMKEVAATVMDECDWRPADVDRAILDYVEPELARRIAEDLGFSSEQIIVPTERFGHVMTGGLPMALALTRDDLESGARVLLAEAGPGLTWGAAALEL